MSFNLGCHCEHLSKAKGAWQSVIPFRDGFPRLLRSLGMPRVSQLSDIAGDGCPYGSNGWLYLSQSLRKKGCLIMNETPPANSLT